jgi:hypothetical protein
VERFYWAARFHPELLRMRASRTPSVIATMTSLSITIIATEFLLEGIVEVGERGPRKAEPPSWARRDVCTNSHSHGEFSKAGRLLLARARTGGVVLIVADVLTPVGGDVLVVDFVEREVDHQPGRGGAVPVLFIGLDVDAVARADHLDRAAAALDQPDPLGDEEVCPRG